MVGAKGTQRKLGRLWKDFLQRSDLQELTEGLDRNDETEIFFDDDVLHDDLDAFKEAAEAAFRCLARSRGKKSRALNALQELMSILDDQFQTPPKRPLVAVEEAPERIKRSRTAETLSRTPLLKEHRAELKLLGNELAAISDMEPFIYPVDKSTYPEYYEVISNPMDLSAWRKKISSFETLEESLEGIRLIWRNCLQFNEEKSPIAQQALSAAAKAEKLIETHFGKSFVDANWKQKPACDTKSPTASTPDMQALLNALLKNKSSEPFLFPVDLSAAPGYLDVISTPMDLSTVKKRLQAGSYNKDPVAFLQDINTIWQNCMEYNDPESDIAQVAQKLQMLSSKLALDLGFPPYNWTCVEHNTSRKRVKQSESPKEAKLEPLNEQQMRLLLSKMEKFEFVEPFLYPVDIQAVPGYLDIVAIPMDLSTVKKNLKSGNYSKAPVNFVLDVQRIWKNCQEYNEPGSDIFEWSKRCEVFFQKALSHYGVSSYSTSATSAAASLSSVAASTTATTTDPSGSDNTSQGAGMAAPASSKLKCAANDRTSESEQEMGHGSDGAAGHTEEEDDAMEIEDAIGDRTNEQENPLSAKPKKSRNGPPFPLRRFKSVLRQLLAHEQSEQFRSKGGSSKAPAGVSNPLDLNSLYSRVESYQHSPERFLADLAAVFDPYLQHCAPDSQMYKSAETLKAFSVEIFHKNFPHLVPGKAKAEGTGGEQKVATDTIAKPTDAKASSSTVHPSKHDVSASPALILPFDHSGVTGSTSVYKEPPNFVSQEKTALQDLDALLEQVADVSTGLAVKLTHERAVELISNTLVPFHVENRLLEVLHFGTIPKGGGLQCADFICPDNFSSKVQVKIVLVNVQSEAILAEINSTLKSSIRYVSSSTPRFVVSLESGTVVADQDSPLSAWQAIRGKEAAVLRSLGSKLRRCRAVFNRLCVSPDSEPFLERVPLNGVGVHYYKVITAPMWLREVHERLASGQYENEFDFVWDVRLIFKNCCEYNTPESDLFQAAQRLSNLFEQLFSRWVVSVVDAHIDVEATGPWDDWMHLQYFDGGGSIKGSDRARKSSGVACYWCKDSCSTSSQRQSIVACTRCSVALQCGNGSLALSPFESDETFFGGSSVSNVSADASIFVPVPDIGVGWCLAKRRSRITQKHVYLSPLGYEVHGKDGIAAQKAFEETVDAQLLAARAKEFSEGLTSGKKSSGGKAGMSRGGARQSDIGMLKAAEDYGFVVGRLQQFVPPEGTCLSIRVPINFKTVEFVDVDKSELPSSGLFGLQALEVQQRIEGMDNFEQCQTYINSHLESMIETCRSGLLRRRAVVQEICNAAETLQKKMCQERWYWRKLCLYPSLSLPGMWTTSSSVENNVASTNNHTSATSSSASSYSHLSSVKSGFKPFLLGNLQHSILEVIFTLWDFLHAIEESEGPSYFTLLDLVKSVNPPVSLLTNCSQVVFDEVNCILTGYLFADTRYWAVSGRTALLALLDFRTPINIITWPAVAEKVVLTMSLPLSEHQARRLLLQPYEEPALLVLKLFCLFCNHPLFDMFFDQEVASCTRAGQKMGALVERVVDGDTQLPSIISEITDSLTAIAEDPFAARYHSASKHYLAWLAGLARAWNFADVLVDNVMEDASCESALWTWDSFRDRAWGGFTLRRKDITSDFVLKVHDFSTEASTWEKKMKALTNLERSLHILTSSDSENWCATDRVAIYSTLVDYGMATTKFSQNLATCEALCNEIWSTIPTKDLDNEAFVSDFHTKPVSYLPKKARCAITNISSAVVPDASAWCVVSEPFERGMDSGEPTGGVDAAEVKGLRERNRRPSSGKEETIHALNCAVTQLSQCREAAKSELAEFESNIKKILAGNEHRLVQDVFSETNHIVRFRSLPLGFDRTGNSYWMLGAQESMTIFPYDGAGRALDPADQLTTEPCILCRDKHGNWSYHCGRNVEDLALSFSDDILCERMLKLRLIERYSIVRTRLRNNVQQIRPAQQVWMERKMNLERWIAEMTLYNGPNDSHRSRQLEVVWARCSESRINLQCAFLHRAYGEIAERIPIPYERERLQRRQRQFSELSADDCFDLHPTKGWTRVDPFARILQLSASTTASRLLGDSNTYSIVQNTISKSVFTQKGALLAAACSVAAEQRTKNKAFVLQHPITFEPLHEFDNIDDAAAFVGQSPDSFLQLFCDCDACCYGGFRWELKIRDPERRFTPKADELRIWKSLRAKVVDEKSLIVSDNLTDANAESAAAELRFTYQTPVGPRVQPHVTTSTSTVSAKLVKLKGELLNLLFIFPEKALRWPDQDSVAEAAIAAAGESAAAQVHASAAKFAASGQVPSASIDLSPENIERLADRAARKAKRRLRRKLAMENFVHAVQKATCSEQLQEQLSLLESIIPSSLLFQLPAAGSEPTSAAAASSLALRLYALDRRIAYNELAGVENAALAAPVRLRYQFVPRCANHPNCTRFIGHTGKCLPGPTNLSRLPDHFQLAPPQDNFSQGPGARDTNRASLQAPSAHQEPTKRQQISNAPSTTVANAVSASHPPPPNRIIMPKEDPLLPLAVLQERTFVDIEMTIPYLPNFHELAATEWL